MERDELEVLLHRVWREGYDLGVKHGKEQAGIVLGQSADENATRTECCDNALEKITAPRASAPEVEHG